MTTQRKSNKYRMIWVAPEFATRLKSESALNGCSMFDFTKHIARSEERVSDMFKESDKKLKRGFRFEL